MCGWAANPCAVVTSSLSPCWRRSSCWCCRRTHPLASKGALTPAALADEPWVTCPRHDSHLRLIAILGNQAPLYPRRAGSLRLAATMVAVGAGDRLVAPFALSARLYGRRAGGLFLQAAGGALLRPRCVALGSGGLLYWSRCAGCSSPPDVGIKKGHPVGWPCCRQCCLRG